MLCAPSRRAGASAATRRAAPTRLRALRIDALEVLQHGPSLVGGEAAQLVPRGLAVSDRAAAAEGPLPHNDRRVGTGPRLALPGILALILLECEAGVEQPMVQALLPLEEAGVDPSAIERVGDLAHLLGQLLGAPRPFSGTLHSVG